MGLDWPLGTAESVWNGERPWRGRLGEADDRAVPGSWEGDLLIGKDCKSAVGILVERTSRSILLLHLPAQRLPGRARDAASDHHQARRLARTITWDRGKRNGLPRGLHHRHRHPGLLLPAHKPWQRGSNENTNGLLHQKVLVAAHPAARQDQSTAADPGGDVTRLSDPHLVEQRAGVIRGLLAVPDPGGDEPSL